MTKVMTPIEVVAHSAKENMTADLAVKLIQLAVLGTTYLEKKAQESVNADGAVIASQVAAKENVDAESIFYSHKDKVKASKTVKALTGMIDFGNMVIEAEQKAKAIETTKAPTDEALPAPAK